MKPKTAKTPLPRHTCIGIDFLAACAGALGALGAVEDDIWKEAPNDSNQRNETPFSGKDAEHRHGFAEGPADPRFDPSEGGCYDNPRCFLDPGRPQPWFSPSPFLA